MEDERKINAICLRVSTATFGPPVGTRYDLTTAQCSFVRRVGNIRDFPHPIVLLNRFRRCRFEDAKRHVLGVRGGTPASPAKVVWLDSPLS